MWMEWKRGKVEVCSEAQERKRGNGESGTTRWHPNKSKIAGTLYRQCWYCNVLNDASRKENVRLGYKYFETSILVPRYSQIFFDVHFPFLPRQPRTIQSWKIVIKVYYSTIVPARRSTTYRVSNRTGIVGFAINEVSTVNDIVKSCNLAGELSVSAAILIGSPPHSTVRVSTPISIHRPPLCWPGSTEERSSIKLFN